MSDPSPNTLITRFKFQKLLNTDQAGRRLILLGTISNTPALLLAERGAFSTDNTYLESFSRLMTNIKNLGDNDIYRWYLANSMAENTIDEPTPPDLKLNLIWPCTEKHIAKYSFQQMRVVVETGVVYERFVRRYMQLCREEGRLNWVFNILDGRAERENVLFRSKAEREEDDFLLLPDLNWDRSTLGSMHLLALPIRRDIWSVRDLTKSLVPWLRHLRATLTQTVTDLYPGVESDMLKFYVHYQPTYYHFHVHVVHVNLDATGTQAVGKALGLDHVISQLEHMEGGEEAGMHQVDLGYTVGENSELWQQIYLPLKEGREPSVGGSGGK
ncbi:m7GpppX diphosphatase [Fulvia fulva]|uniref:M7GpppX diphosphatase n=1 Tax=Passalora fulva TaxID=5499 RepID=A0A9Q8USW4_PASFU|nr:m7GpppX diphosphatase [Fulvia fulva]UJO21221.1 m7GpppX diphosphatase [Fulvia fulva]WPV33242.1 m7GpppX diphosphatase [Fulvia fulva]